MPLRPRTARSAVTSRSAVPLPLSRLTKAVTVAPSTAQRALLTVPSKAKLANDATQLAVGVPPVPKLTLPTRKINLSLVTSPVAAPLKRHSTIPLRTLMPPRARLGGIAGFGCTAITEMAIGSSGDGLLLSQHAVGASQIQPWRTSPQLCGHGSGIRY